MRAAARRAAGVGGVSLRALLTRLRRGLDPELDGSEALSLRLPPGAYVDVECAGESLEENDRQRRANAGRRASSACPGSTS